MSLLHSATDATQRETENPKPDNKRRRRSGEPPVPPEQGPAHTGGSLTRVTANFTPRAMASLERVSDKTGDSRTDVLNMAVMAYETILELIEEGGTRNLRVQMPNGEVRVLQFIG
jgi:hypothetical protein